MYHRARQFDISDDRYPPIQIFCHLSFYEERLSQKTIQYYKFPVKVFLEPFAYLHPQDKLSFNKIVNQILKRAFNKQRFNQMMKDAFSIEDFDILKSVEVKFEEEKSEEIEFSKFDPEKLQNFYVKLN